MNIINYDDKANEINMDDIIFHGIDYDNDFLYIYWSILYECNYKCSYCFGQAPLSNNFTPIEKLKHAVDRIFKIEKQFYYFVFMGGEATYYPYFIELIEYITSYNKKVYFSIITNGSKSKEYFDKLLSSIKNNYFYCAFSIHLEYANMQHIEDIIKVFNKYDNSNLFIRVMAHPELEEKSKYFFNELSSLINTYKFHFDITELFEPPSFTEIDRRYTEQFLEYIAKNRYTYSICNTILPNGYFKTKNNDCISINGKIAISNYLRVFKKFYCCSINNMIFIDQNGCYRGIVCESFPILGNIYEEDIDFNNLINYCICKEDQCRCSVNDLVPKYRSKIEADNCISKYRKENMNLIIEQFIKLSNNKINILNDRINTLNNEINILSNENTYIKDNNKKLVDTIAWWIPIKKLREKFRNNFR